MKKSISGKIERLLEKTMASTLSSSADPEHCAFRKEALQNDLIPTDLEKFCRKIPFRLFQFFHPGNKSGI
jgi:hypothetical protein